MQTTPAPQPQPTQTETVSFSKRTIMVLIGLVAAVATGSQFVDVEDLTGENDLEQRVKAIDAKLDSLDRRVLSLEHGSIDIPDTTSDTTSSDTASK